MHSRDLTCPRCWARFGKQDDRDNHLRYDGCPNSRFEKPEEICDDEKELIKTDTRRGGVKMSEEQRWFLLWDNLFPGFPQPGSAFIQPGMAEPVSVLCERLPRCMREGMPGLLPRYRIVLQENDMDSFIRDLVNMVRHVPNSPPRSRRERPSPPSLGEAASAAPARVGPAQSYYAAIPFCPGIDSSDLATVLSAAGVSPMPDFTGFIYDPLSSEDYDLNTFNFRLPQPNVVELNEQPNHQPSQQSGLD